VWPLLIGAGAMVVLTAALAAYAANFTTRQLAPIWGRWADVFEWLALMAVVPLTLWVLDVFALALGLTG
jgi:hypothetical protein